MSCGHSVEAAWLSVPVHIQSLFDSMPRCISAVITVRVSRGSPGLANGANKRDTNDSLSALSPERDQPQDFSRLFLHPSLVFVENRRIDQLVIESFVSHEMSDTLLDILRRYL
ncbi:hypothetical protein TNCV_1854521 [Trichonephila clavipes]|nr:hypothetical protein TNCV_1854521 [Trichonephila clavipes]